MTALVALALAGALGCWPHAPAPWRLRTVMPRPPEDGSTGAARCAQAPVALLRRPPAPLAAVGSAGVGAIAAGAGGAVAALVLGTVVLRLRRAGRRRSDRAAATHALAEGLGSFAAELRSGAPPAAAARAAARDAGSGTTGPGGSGPRAITTRIAALRKPGQPGDACSRALALVEATARLGGDVPAALRTAAAADPLAGDDLRRFAGAWALAERHGIGLAGLAEAVAVDLRARSRFDGALKARVAGPRATATVLAALPVLGILLGEGIGARPWAVLSGGFLGQGLLVVGVGLIAAGIEWTERIVAGVTR